MSGANVLSASSAAPQVLYSDQLSSTSETIVYTVPTNGSAIIKHGVLCNTTGSPVTVSIGVYQFGQGLSSQNQALKGYSLIPNDALPIADYLGGACLGSGDFITVTAGTANVVNVILSGVENS